jgi:hypothetical protein
MGLLGSQAGNEKNCWLWILSNFLGPFFHVFMGKIFFFLNSFLPCRVRTKKLLDTKIKKFKKEFGKIFFIIKNSFFRTSCFGYRVKGLSPLLLPLVSLVSVNSSFWNPAELIILPTFQNVLIRCVNSKRNELLTYHFWGTTEC